MDHASSPSARIIDGSAHAATLRAEVASRVEQLRAKGKAVHLTALLVGFSGPGDLYARRQREACDRVGIDYELRTLPAKTDAASLSGIIAGLNHDPSVSGIMLHLPLPSQLDATEMQYQIDPVKDVEGVNPANIGYVVYGHTLIAPCTALAVIELIRLTGIPLRGAEAVVVGASEIAGKPISLLLTEQMATVTLCHIATRDLQAHTRRADVLVVAAGKPGLIGPDHVRPGAVVIDVGINQVQGPDGKTRTVGDVATEAVAAKLGSSGWVSPVPGGVGPVTVAMLLKNTVRAAELVQAAQ